MSIVSNIIVAIADISTGCFSSNKISGYAKRFGPIEMFLIHNVALQLSRNMTLAQ